MIEPEALAQSMVDYLRSLEERGHEHVYAAPINSSLTEVCIDGWVNMVALADFVLDAIESEAAENVEPPRNG